MTTVIEFGSRGNAWWGRVLGDQQWHGEGEHAQARYMGLGLALRTVTPCAHISVRTADRVACSRLTGRELLAEDEAYVKRCQALLCERAKAWTVKYCNILV